MKASLLGLGLLALVFAQEASASSYRQALGTQLFMDQVMEEQSAQQVDMDDEEDGVIEIDIQPVDEDMPRLSDALDSDALLTRAQFTTMMVDHLYTQGEIERCFWDIAPSHPPSFSLVFTDVPVTNMYAKHICIAMRDGLVRGYRDGSFHPNQSINMAEASKIISRAYALAPFAELDTTGSWFSPYLYALTVRNAVPASITSLRQSLTAGELNEMLNRLEGDVTWEPATSYDEFVAARRAVANPTPVTPTAPSSTGTSSSAVSGTVSSKQTTSAAPASAAASSVSQVQLSSSSKGAFWNPFD